MLFLLDNESDQMACIVPSPQWTSCFQNCKKNISFLELIWNCRFFKITVCAVNFARKNSSINNFHSWTFSHSLHPYFHPFGPSIFENNIIERFLKYLASFLKSVRPMIFIFHLQFLSTKIRFAYLYNFRWYCKKVRQILNNENREIYALSNMILRNFQ